MQTRIRRGKVVEIPKRWQGVVTHRQTIQKRASKGPRKHRHRKAKLRGKFFGHAGRVLRYQAEEKLVVMEQLEQDDTMRMNRTRVNTDFPGKRSTKTLVIHERRRRDKDAITEELNVETKGRSKCPDDWRPGCSCRVDADEPSDDCHVHGAPDPKQCPYCGLFRGYSAPCKRCGCMLGLPKETP